LFQLVVKKQQKSLYYSKKTDKNITTNELVDKIKVKSCHYFQLSSDAEIRVK